MDLEKFGKENKRGNLIVKTWQRCKSLGRGSKKTISGALATKSKSLPRLHFPSLFHEQENEKSSRRRVAPEGCFSVYVGPDKQRFVIKTEYANHPLFKVLLEEAESEYGYNPEGPLQIPCNVDIFWKVLVAMDSNDDDEKIVNGRNGCGFYKNYSPYRLVSPSKMIALNHF